MTTITYKDGIIAYDSRCVCGGTIVDEDIDKHREVNGVHFFFAGNTADQDLLVSHYLGEKAEIDANTRCDGVVVDAGKLYMVGMSQKNGYFKCPERLDNFVSLGSGEDYALTAMDMGATAKEAVKWAMKRDTGTGGRIRTFKIK